MFKEALNTTKRHKQKRTKHALFLSFVRLPAVLSFSSAASCYMGNRWPSTLAHHSSEHLKRKPSLQKLGIMCSIPTPAHLFVVFV